MHRDQLHNLQCPVQSGNVESYLFNKNAEKQLKILKQKSDVVVHGCFANTSEAKTGESRVSGQPGLYNKTMSPKGKTKQKVLKHNPVYFFLHFTFLNPIFHLQFLLAQGCLLGKHLKMALPHLIPKHNGGKCPTPFLLLLLVPSKTHTIYFLSFRITIRDQVWWLRPIIPTTQEWEIRKIMVKSILGKEYRTLSEK